MDGPCHIRMSLRVCLSCVTWPIHMWHDSFTCDMVQTTSHVKESYAITRAVPFNSNQLSFGWVMSHVKETYKETCIHKKRPIYIYRKETYSKYFKVDKETYKEISIYEKKSVDIYEKRPIYMKRDLYIYMKKRPRQSISRQTQRATRRSIHTKRDL